MKKYKLIKEYPSSPKLGTIVKQESVFHYYTEGLKLFYSVKDVENNPEFWEEVKEKEWEILSLKYRGSIYYKSEECVIKSNFKKYKTSDSKGFICLEDINDSSEGNYILINSVKRLSS